ncbi:Zinc finger, PMZ-type [Sesbania bispinosa]|nr:Zinc finger, PMZ-type [Sesbania bispinosa]
MEIDLELPICEHEKFDIESNGNDVADTVCDIHVEVQNNNPSSMTEHYKEVLSENAFCYQDQVDLNSNQVDTIDKNGFKEPQNGLEFESKEAAYSFYREYARTVGFGITIKASRRSKKSGKFIDIKIACSRFGSKRESGTKVNPRPCMKTDCKAGMHMKKKLDGNWIIYNFVKEHNHEICPNDFLRGRSKQTSNVACQKKGMQLALDKGDVQFEKRWWKLINRFELKNNECVQSLYEDRKKWVPTFMQDVSLVGLSTTVRSESTTSSFDKYIRVDSTFKEFIEQYKVFSTHSFDMEAKADFETRQRQLALRSLSPFEKQLSTIYTDVIFRKIQLEIVGAVSCCLRKETEDRTNVTFLVDDFEERKKFVVSWNKADLVVCCSCHLFQYKGFLCRHAILVIQMSGITNIPSRYILKRWTKDAKAYQFAGDLISRAASRMQRFNDLCRRAIILSEIGSFCEDSHRIASQALEEVYKHCMNANNSTRSTLEPNNLALNGFVDVEEKNYGFHRTKSTKKRKSYNKRECSGPERINIKMLDSFQKREQRISRAHNFDNCYISQQDTKTVHLDSRASTLDSYYGAQQNVLGDAQLNSVSVMHDNDYYSSQQAILGLGQMQSVPSGGPHYGMQHSVQGLLQGQHIFRTPTVHGCFDLQDSLEDMEQPLIRASQCQGIPSKQLAVDKPLS